jgi:hypothetical protein
MAVPLPPPGFDDLSVDEQLDYLQSLWERIAAAAATVPVPDWHQEVVRERLDDLATTPDAGEDWAVVRDRIRKKLSPQLSSPPKA